MELGFVSAILGDQSLDEVLRHAAEARYECVEVMCWPSGGDARRYAGVRHLDVERWTEAQIAEVKRSTQSSGIRLSALGYYPNVLSPDVEEAHLTQEHLRQVIRAAGSLGLGVNTFIGRDWTRSLDQNWQRMLDVWGGLLELASRENVRVGIENCPMFFSEDEWPGGKNLATSPAVWRRLFADLPNVQLGLNFDPSHFVWQQMDYVTPLREFRERLFHIHAKDARIDRDRLNDVGILANPSAYHTPKLPGLGDVNWGAFFGMLSEVGYNGPVCVEVEDRAFEGSLTNRLRALRQSANYLRQFVS